MAILSTLAAGAGLASAGVGLYNKLTQDGDGDRSPAARQRQQILERLQRSYEQGQNQSPAQSAHFQASTAQLRRQNERQKNRDEAQAAARGLEGSQFEVAQNAVRARTMAQGQQRALGQSARIQNQKQQRRLGHLMTGLNQQDANYWRRREEKVRRRGQILNALGSAAQSAAIVGSNFTGGSGGGGTGSEGEFTGLGMRGHYA